MKRRDYNPIIFKLGSPFLKKSKKYPYPSENPHHRSNPAAYLPAP
jgi:hypothetical protein